jgi:hypothetical protein
MAESTDVVARLTQFGKLWHDLKASVEARAKEYQEYEDKLWGEYVSKDKRPPEEMVQKLYQLREARNKAQQAALDAPSHFIRSYGAEPPKRRLRTSKPRLSR